MKVQWYLLSVRWFAGKVNTIEGNRLEFWSVFFRVSDIICKFYIMQSSLEIKTWTQKIDHGFQFGSVKFFVPSQGNYLAGRKSELRTPPYHNNLSYKSVKTYSFRRICFNRS